MLLLSALNIAPSASVNLSWKNRVPVVPNVPLTVTFSKLPEFDFRTVLSLLTTVPRKTVPPRLVSPPVPNGPALPISSVSPALSRKPLKLTSPPVRVIVPRPLVVVATFKFSIVLGPTATVPVLVKLIGPSTPRKAKVPALTCKVP